MSRSKEDLWVEYQATVPDLSGFPDVFICVFYWLILERWQDQLIRSNALILLSQYRPHLAADIKTCGPMTVFVKATWNKKR